METGNAPHFSQKYDVKTEVVSDSGLLGWRLVQISYSDAPAAKTHATPQLRTANKEPVYNQRVLGLFLLQF